MPRDIFAIVQPTKQQAIALRLTADPKENASPEQQAIAIKLIKDNFCNMDALQYMEGSFDGTAFLNGRDFVGRSIEQILNINISELPSENDRLDQL